MTSSVKNYWENPLCLNPLCPLVGSLFNALDVYPKEEAEEQAWSVTITSEEPPPGVASHYTSLAFPFALTSCQPLLSK